MTPEQVKLIRDSFAKVAPVSDRLGRLFYGRLFEIAPQVRPLFKGDIANQGRKFMATLTVGVSSLENFDALKPALQALARQHAGLGVRPEHYQPLGEALVWALDEGLGADFTEETRAAWEAAYGAIAGTMIAATKKA
ncbi:MAG TPA: globin family protein [Rhodoblastus sp.]|nr:globin family protein [Rhodoblastus sp.]